jgi:pyruvate/2-oxoglutarate dehydrogenase complex dihydrolipoamide acyltransferase (E2) component
MPVIKVNVPDVGDFKDIPVIEVLVKPGDQVQEEDSLLTLESDKATMDVPSPLNGTNWTTKCPKDNLSLALNQPMINLKKAPQKILERSLIHLKMILLHPL